MSSVEDNNQQQSSTDIEDVIMADEGASKGVSGAGDEKMQSASGSGSVDQVKGDNEQQRNQLSQLATNIVGQALSEAESEISVHDKYQIGQPSSLDRAGES